MENMLPKIILKHSRIEINNYELEDAPKLEYIFTIYNKIYHTRFIKGMDYNPEKKILYLPRGMNVEYVKDTFMSEPYIDRNPDPFIRTNPIPIRYLTKDQRQLDILKFILGQDQYSYTAAKSQIAVNSTTGSGKTFVTVAAMCFSGSRAIIITSNTNWLQQWKARILEYTNLRPEQIYMIIGRPALDKLIARNNPLDYQFFLASHSTIRSYGDKYGWDKVDELFKFLQCSVKIFDEAHLYFDNMAKIDFHSNTRKTLYLTATPERSDKQEDIIYQEYFRNIPSIELFDESTDPHVNYVSILFESHPNHYQYTSFTKGQYNFDRPTYVSYLVNQPNFRKLVSVIIDMTLRINGKILIYIQTNEAISEVYNYIINEFPGMEKCIGIYTSMTDKNFKAQMLYKKFILSTTKSSGAASDIPDLACVVVLAEPFKSPVTARQTLGRCRNDNTLYIDCVDTSVYRTKFYYDRKKYIFMQYAKSCKEVYMNDEELDKRFLEIHNRFHEKKLMTIPVFKK